jgi:para-nitrobenzyl esterase
LLALAGANNMNGSLVRIRQGLLRGNCSDDVCFFGRIPFAAPPIGDRRWKAPQPPPRWTGERDATAHGPMCLQVEDGVVGDEDCLHLNIYASRRCLTAGGCATMLWLHGGGYVIGSGINYDGTKNVALAKDVLIVTTNYRTHHRHSN